MSLRELACVSVRVGLGDTTAGVADGNGLCCDLPPVRASGDDGAWQMIQLSDEAKKVDT
jgi:hypothetical protein